LFHSSENDNLVMGTTFRLVPIITSVTHSYTQQKCSRMRERQGAFLHQLENLRSRDIVLIDVKDPLLGNKSLRDLIMELTLPQDPTVKLFFSADATDDSYVFSYYSGYNSTAHMVNADLFSYLKFLNPLLPVARLSRCFTYSAVERSLDNEWDAEQCLVVTQDDRHMSSFQDNADDDLFLFNTDIAQRFVLDMTALRAQAAGNGYAAPVVIGGDNDSISTFHPRGPGAPNDLTPVTTQRPVVSLPGSRPAGNQPPSLPVMTAHSVVPGTLNTPVATLTAPSTQSIQSDLSMESRMSRLEMDNLKMRLKLMQTNKQLMLFLASQNQSAPSAGVQDQDPGTGDVP
jgi:hypothetical protein